jgi:hypothetical protein
MRWYVRSGAAAASVWLGLGLALGVVLAAGGASAASTTAKLGVQLGPQKTGTYGTVQITEVGGGLEFQITLDPVLGKNADLHEFYFNLPDTFSNVHLSDAECAGSSCRTPFRLDSHKSTSGGAGASFDFRVSFGNGAGSKGNGKLQEASFRIDANTALALFPSPFDASFTSRNLEVIFAAHVPGSKGVAATIGATTVAPVPEPATAVLFGLGLVGVAWVGRRRPAA